MTSTASRTPLVGRPDQAARLGVRLVLDEALAGTTGEFFTSTPGIAVLPATLSRRSTDLREAVWRRSEELTEPWVRTG